MSNQSRHLSNRIAQLSSPAFFVIVGFSLPVLGKFFTTDSRVYFAYFISFIVFAIVVILIAKLANLVSYSAEEMQEKLNPTLAVFACFTLSGILIWCALTDMRPKKVEVTFETFVYQELEEMAKVRNMTVKQLIELITLSKLSDSN